MTTFAVSDRFSVPVYLALLTDSDGVYFANAHYTALFGWQSGSYTRLLQSNDPHPGVSDSVTGATGLGLTANADGDLAMANYWLGEDGAALRGIFVYDGANFQEVVRRGDVAPGTSGAEFWHMYVRGLNNSHQVVFLGYCGPTGTEYRGIFVGSPSGGGTIKIALEGETVSGVGTIEGLYPIGIDNSGNVAFSARVTGGSTDFAILVGAGSGLTKIAANGDTAPGTAGHFDIRDGRFFMNAGGQVAFEAEVIGDPSTAYGIWIGSSYPPQKLVLSSESTPIGGTFGYCRILGLNDSGLALFLRDSSVNEALFVKSLSADAGVVAEQGDTVPGDSDLIDQIPLALLNNSGNVAFLAVLDDAEASRGWFYDGGVTVDPVVVAIEGDTTPAGGTFGLASVSSNTLGLNGAGQVLFNADILGPDEAGLFLWTPPSGNGSTLEAVVTSDTTLPPGAETLLRCFGGTYDGPRASDKEVLFWALKAGGQATVFTKGQQPGKGKVRRVVGEGDVLPGGGRALMLRFPTINDREEVAVWATDVIDGSGEYPASAIVLSSPSGGLESLVRTGDAVPGPGGLTFQYVSGYPDLNNSGEVAFRARMSDNRDGIFVVSTTGVVEVIRDGEPAPPGGNIHYLGNAPAINDDGEVAFYAQNDDSPRIGGLFVKGSSGIRTIVADGVPWDSVEFSSIDPQFQFNNEGSVAFYSTLSGTPDAGIFIGDGSALTPVALLGDSIPGSGTISELRDPGFSLNNSSQVAFWAGISGAPETSGFYLWSPSAGPPEPRLLEGQALPGGGTAGVVGWGGFGAYMLLADSGEMTMLLENVNGPPDLPRIVIADPDGTLRKFLTGGESAPGVAGTLARFYPLLEVNSAGRFFAQAYLVGGPAKSAIFRDGIAKKP